MLKNIFQKLCLKYSTNEPLINKIWNEIEINYSNNNRFYHNFQHLENIYAQLLNCKDNIKQWDVMLFTLFFHDVIYDASKNDNEEQSAKFAELSLIELGLDKQQIQLCSNQILATKNHLELIESDTLYFLDADLSILGVHWDEYEIYFNSIRKEYSIYDDAIYNAGRINVLNHFINMDKIFKTTFFHHKFEIKAKENIKKEKSILANKLLVL